ncbi:MAG: peptidoglycan-binding protein, partial [Cyanobacteria bacterium J06598_3]
DLYFGAAFDLAEDGLTNRGLVAIAPYFEEKGYVWGARFSNFEDPGHFEASRQLIERWRSNGWDADVDSPGTRSLIPASDPGAPIPTGTDYPGYALEYQPGASVRYNNRVKQWQQRMKGLGWAIAVDGEFGPQSRGIAKSFQSQDATLENDGIVGLKTWAASFSPDAKGPSTAPVSSNRPKRAIEEDDPQQAEPTSPIPSGPVSAERPKRAIEEDDPIVLTGLPYPGVALKYSPNQPVVYRSDVERWQQRMQDLGLDIVVDGKYGPQSQGVALQFQQQHSALINDGIVGPKTWAASFADTTLSNETAPSPETVSEPTGQAAPAASDRPKRAIEEDEPVATVPAPASPIPAGRPKRAIEEDQPISAEVMGVQTRLMALGYALPNWGADGLLGSETTAALGKFQFEHGLKPTKELDEATLTALQWSHIDERNYQGSLGAIANGISIKGRIGATEYDPLVSRPEKDSSDLYRFSVEKDQTIKIHLGGLSDQAGLTLLDTHLKRITLADGVLNNSIIATLKAGEYVVRVSDAGETDYLLSISDEVTSNSSPTVAVITVEFPTEEASLKALEKQLETLGYKVAPTHDPTSAYLGKVFSTLEAAIQAFQADIGISVSGETTPNTLLLIDAASDVLERLGAVNPAIAVEILQLENSLVAGGAVAEDAKLWSLMVGWQAHAFNLSVPQANRLLRLAEAEFGAPLVTAPGIDLNSPAVRSLIKKGDRAFLEALAEVSMTRAEWNQLMTQKDIALATFEASQAGENIDLQALRTTLSAAGLKLSTYEDVTGYSLSFLRKNWMVIQNRQGTTLAAWPTETGPAIKTNSVPETLTHTTALFRNSDQGSTRDQLIGLMADDAEGNWQAAALYLYGGGDPAHINKVRFGLAEAGVEPPANTFDPLWTWLESVSDRAQGIFPAGAEAWMQAESGLDPNTVTDPNLDITGLQMGSVGDKVKHLQRQLSDLGYRVDFEDLPSDETAVGNGTFGDRTQAAVRQFQRDFGIVYNVELFPDGEADPTTLKAISQANALSMLLDLDMANNVTDRNIILDILQLAPELAAQAGLNAAASKLRAFTAGWQAKAFGITVGQADKLLQLASPGEGIPLVAVPGLDVRSAEVKRLIAQDEDKFWQALADAAVTGDELIALADKISLVGDVFEAFKERGEAIDTEALSAQGLALSTVRIDTVAVENVGPIDWSVITDRESDVRIAAWPNSIEPLHSFLNHGDHGHGPTHISERSVEEWTALFRRGAADPSRQPDNDFRTEDTELDRLIVDIENSDLGAQSAALLALYRTGDALIAQDTWRNLSEDEFPEGGLNLSDIGHIVLDLLGLVPILGAAPDLLNGLWYSLEGDSVNAAFSFAAAAPLVGYSASVAKYAPKLADVLQQNYTLLTRGAQYANRAEAAININEGVGYTLDGEWTNALIAFGFAGLNAAGEVSFRNQLAPTNSIEPTGQAGSPPSRNPNDESVDSLSNDTSNGPAENTPPIAAPDVNATDTDLNNGPGHTTAPGGRIDETPTNSPDDPQLPSVDTVKRNFRTLVKDIILADPNHPLRGLLDLENQKLPKDIHAGHLQSNFSLKDGERHRIALESGNTNSADGGALEAQGQVLYKEAIDIGGVPVDVN